MAGQRIQGTGTRDQGAALNLTPENLELEERISTLLRSAEMLAAAMKASAQAEAAEIIAAARADAALLIKEVEEERDDARRVVLEARRQANDILDEASKRAERAARIQRLFLDRLRGARDEVDNLTMMLESIDDTALVDLTPRRGASGQVTRGRGPLGKGAAHTSAHEPFPRREHLDPGPAEDPQEDLVTDMVRAAVGRAIEQSRSNVAHA